MYFLESEYPESDYLFLIQESINDESQDEFKELILDPMIKVFETPSGQNKYVELGNEFIETNSEMLSKEYPTKPVAHPRRYVDRVFDIFGFDVKEFKKTIRHLLSKIGNSDYTIIENPTNVIHTIALWYADVQINKKVRDSARQQLGLSMYRSTYNTYFSAGFINEGVMAYTFMNLSGKWGLVKSENMINWLGNTIETSYQFWRSKITLNISMIVIAKFLDRADTSFNQNLKELSHLYYKNIDEQNSVGSDVDGTDAYVTSNNFISIRDNLINMISSGDSLYKSSTSALYQSVARLKNVKTEALYDFAKIVKRIDIAKIIDGIFYVYLIKEGNDIKDINTAKYISRITNFPTAVDRAIQGRPIILPMTKKYKTDSNIVKAYICLIATYIMLRINDVNQPD